MHDVLLPRVLAEPSNNVAPRIAGERYEGGKLVGVAKSNVVALHCTVQGSPVPVTRYFYLYKDEHWCVIFVLESDPFYRGEC